MRSAALRFGVLACVLGACLVAPAGASALDKLTDVACTSSTFCLAVGASDAEAGSAQAQARSWNGSKWSAVETPAPEGAIQSDLAALTCTSATHCVAVGDYADSEEETTLALAMGWDGTEWDTAELPRPAGALSTTLAELTCPLSTSCIAVGSYLDSAEVRKPLAISWNGLEWTLLSVPVPSGAGLSDLEGISCTATNDCVAVGSFVNSSEVTKTLAVSWNGSAWSVNSTPEPAGSELNQLYDVSCRPTDACTAVGTYFNASGEQKTLALRRNTSKVWSVQSTPDQAGALSNRLTAVSCPTNTACTATGIVEQGSKDLPLTLSWNGTSWSQQAIDSEALGASSVKLASLSCISATNCKAVGAVAYGRSAADRNLAFAWNGSAWLVSEAGEYERKWLRLDASPATRGLSSVSCPEALACFAAGASSDDLGNQKGQIASWGGEDWSVKAAPAPEGAKASELTGIACATAASCKAVGRYTDSEGVERALVQSWNGSAWSIQSAPAPEGAKATELAAVDCFSASACTAAGSYIDAEGARLPLALTWNGSAWSLASVPAPEAAAGGWLQGVSCTSASACTAVGARADAFGFSESFAVKRDGSNWAEHALPEIAGNPASFLSSISCTGASACLTVGGLEGQNGAEYLLAWAWDGSEWTEVEPPPFEGSVPHVYSPEEPEGDSGSDPSAPSSPYTSFTSVSCAAADNCVAAGGRPTGSTRPPLLLRFDGDSWAEDPPAEYASGASAISLNGVDCHSSTRCATVGSASYGEFPAKNFALSYESGIWLTPYFPAPGGGLRGVSCPQAESCLAVGDAIDPGGDPARLWEMGEDSWNSSPTATVSGAFLSDVSCTAADECTATGRQGTWPFKPLAERFDGEDWSTQSVPEPSGRSSSPEAVSCPTESFCVSVGFSWPATGNGPQNALVQSWNGTSWSTASPSLPGGAVASFLYDVACTSASLCKAAGSYTDSAGVSHGLVLSWNGTSWSSTALTPAGYSSVLRGIDCTSSSACTVVGTATEAATNARTPLAYRWSGSAWTSQAVPLPQGASGGQLRSVDCFSSTRCVAVGSATDAATQNPYVIGWSSGVWKPEPAPAIPGNSSTTLESVSCFAAADCTAVGIAQFEDGPRELLVVQTEGEDPESDDPVSVAGGAVPRLNDEQEEAALEILAEDPAFQAAVGAAEYEHKIGVWTETDEETDETAVVGAYVEVSLEEPENWPERTWPATEYEIGEDGFEGTYEETEFDAAATEIGVLQINLALDFDEQELPIDGQVEEILLYPTGDGEVEIDPASLGEYNATVAGF